MAFTRNWGAADLGLNGVTSTTTGTVIDVSLREKLSFVFLCTGHSSGNGVFTIDGSNDGTNWVTSIAFQDATATASTTFVTSKTLSSNTTAGGYFPFVQFRYLRFVITVTTDGAYSVFAQDYGN
jgi:hypothetical protein